MRQALLGVGLLLLALPGCCRGPSDGTKVWRGPFQSVAVDRDSSCALDRRGEVSCWGEGRAVRQSKPLPGSFQKLALTSGCIVGLRADTTLAAWGPSCGTLPPGGFLAVSGGHHPCAIRNNGDLVCWDARPGVPPRSTPGPFVALTQGGAHGCAIRGNGALHCWGFCRATHTGEARCPGKMPPPAGTWSQVAAGDDFACALDGHGAVTCWGEGRSVGTAPTGAGFQAIAAGGDSACAVDSAGEIRCWGAPISWYNHTYSPMPGPFVGLSMSSVHVCGVRTSGALACWGVDQQGQVTGKAPWPRT